MYAADDAELFLVTQTWLLTQSRSVVTMNLILAAVNRHLVTSRDVPRCVLTG